MSFSKKIDFVALCAITIAGAVIVVLSKANFLSSTFIFLLTPSIYLLIRRTQNIKLVVSGTFLIGVILGFLFDFLATYNNAWIIPDEQLTIPYRIFGTAPVDEIICLVLWVFLMLLFYEHFCERVRPEKLHIKHFIHAGIVPAFLSVIAIVSVYFFKPSLLIFDYAYLILGLLAAAPLFYFAFAEPRMLGRVLKAAPYFIFLYFIFELTSLYLAQWSFPGQYVGYVEMFSFRFPLEECVFWIITSSTVVLADYKLFVDTDK